VIRFLIDAQLSRKLALRLEEHGHRASHVYDHLDPQTDDREIGRLANGLGASVVSKDADFADLATRGLLEKTVVWLKLPNLSNQQLLERLDLALPEIVSACEANERIIEIR
jgi:predicted nuclease of predicted toxin-antitoxin system